MNAETIPAEALRYARDFGWHVFPIDPVSKRPTFRLGQGDHAGCQEGACGSLHATTDQDTIRVWWAEWPDAWLAVRCDFSGLAVLDVDPRNGGRRPADAPATWTARTAGGGLHLLYRAAPDLDLPGEAAPGVDIKYHGHILVAPTPGYRWLMGLGTIADWPGRQYKAAPAYEGPRFEYTGPGAASAEALEHLKPYAERLTEAVALGSGRNNALFLLARTLGQLVSGGEVKAAGALDWVTDLGYRLDVPGARSTARSGYRKGTTKDEPLILRHVDEHGTWSQVTGKVA